MFNKNTLIVAILYSFLFIAGVCYSFYGMEAKYITYAYLLGSLGMLPFVFFVVWKQRQIVFGGTMSGKNAVKEGMKFVVLVILILIVFQIVFFEISFKEYKINYIRTVGPEALKTQIAAGKIKITEAQIPTEIAADVESVTVFKEITAVVFKNVFFGALSSFFAAVLLKRNSNG